MYYIVYLMVLFNETHRVTYIKKISTYLKETIHKKVVTLCKNEYTLMILLLFKLNLEN